MTPAGPEAAILGAPTAAYLETLVPTPDPLVAELTEVARRRRLPIAYPDTAALLEILVEAAQPRRVVEVGVSIGVTTLRMARRLPPGGRIVAVDADPAILDEARGHWARAGVSDRIEGVVGRGLEVLPGLAGPIDFVWIDAVKGEYGGYLDALLPKLSPGAIVAADNLLLDGRAADRRADLGHWDAANIEAIRAFNARFVSEPRLRAVVLPVGDGFGLGVRRRDG
jgi:caffeoyl-CoA O-methyltransferase